MTPVAKGMTLASDDCAVDYKPLPSLAGCTAIRITARTPERVQQEINVFFAKVCEADGLSEFTNPRRRGEFFQSTGYVFEPKGKP